METKTVKSSVKLSKTYWQAVQIGRGLGLYKSTEQQMNGEIMPNMRNFFDICPYTLNELRSSTRKRDLVEWRQVGMLMKLLELKSVSKTARFFGTDKDKPKNHATVIHAVKQVESEIPEIISNVNAVIYYAQNRNVYTRLCFVDKIAPQKVA